MIGDAAHGFLLPVREGEVEEGAHFYRVLEEHLVEVPQSEEEHGIAVACLGAAILVHHGAGVGHGRCIISAGAVVYKNTVFQFSEAL